MPRLLRITMLATLTLLLFTPPQSLADQRLAAAQVPVRVEGRVANPQVHFFPIGSAATRYTLVEIPVAEYSLAAFQITPLAKELWQTKLKEIRGGDRQGALAAGVFPVGGTLPADAPPEAWKVWRAKAPIAFVYLDLQYPIQSGVRIAGGNQIEGIPRREGIRTFATSFAERWLMAGHPELPAKARKLGEARRAAYAQAIQIADLGRVGELPGGTALTMFPLGRADRFYSYGHGNLQCFKFDGRRVKRVWRLDTSNLEDGKGPFPGTLAKFLTLRIPARVPAFVKKDLRNPEKMTFYAAQLISGTFFYHVAGPQGVIERGEFDMTLKMTEDGLQTFRWPVPLAELWFLARKPSP
ncbi:MAG: hypothetical protein ACO1SV_03050 [Fimbriimonas sp.]